MRNGKGFCHIEGSQNGTALIRRIHADQETVAELVARVKRPRIPRGATVTAQAASLLLGVSFPPLLSLIEAGWLKAERVDAEWRLCISDLVAFDKRWILSPELAHRTHGASRLGACLTAPPEPAFRTGRLRAWLRAEGEHWHGLGCE